MVDFNQLLSQAIGSVNQSSQAMLGVSKLLDQNTARMQELSNVNMTEGQQVISDVQRAAGMQAKAKYMQGSMAEKTQNILNINPDAAQNELQISTNALNTAQQEYKIARQEFDKISQTNFLSDPLGYIFGQLNLPQVAARVNAAVDAQTSAESNIATRLDIAKKFNDTVVANTAGTLRDSAVLAAEAEARNSQIRLRQAEIENSSRIAGNLMSQASLADRMSDNKVKIVQMQLSAAQAEASREAAQAAKAQANELRTERLRRMKEESDYEARMDLGLQRVGQFFGMSTPLTLRGIKELSPKLRDSLLTAAMSGTLGSDLAESMRVYATIPGKGNISASNPGVAKFVDQIGTNVGKYEAALTAQAVKTGQKIPANQLGAAAIEEYQADIAASASNPKHTKPLSSKDWDSTFNPYKANHRVMLDEIAGGQLAVLKDNAVANALKTVATTAAPGVPLTVEEEQRALKVVRDMVATRKMTPQEAAAQVSTYYRVAAAKNTDMYQYTIFGIQPQTKYYYTMEPTGLMGKPIPVNLMDATSVERAFMQDVRGAAQLGQVPQPFIGGPVQAIGMGATAGAMKLQELFNKP